MTNGADIKTMFDGNKRILSVKVQNNDDDVEILAVDKGNIIDREKTFFQNDELEMDLSYRSIPTLDIYARTRNELQYIGTVETGAK